MSGFVGSDLVFLQKGQADVVIAVQEFGGVEFVELEGVGKAVSIAHGLGGEVDFERVAFFGGDTLEDLVDLLGAESDRQDAVVKTIIVEDIGVTGGDNGAEAIVEQSPGGVFAG